VTSTAHDPMEMLRGTLEDRFQLHTDQLSELTVLSQQTHRGGYDQQTLAALVSSLRQAVADTADALRRMAEGTYGSCERCAVSIPLDRLEVLPHARLCVSCQQSPVH
jgi:DnaK suppressor protein